ncbi:hypothetical protein [Nitrobacter winogradskyi]|nr:hypothetical protein [Nitrobacter winogradskyi]
MLLEEREALLKVYRPLETDIKAMRFEMYEKQQRLAELASDIEKINLALKAVEDADKRPQITIMEAVVEVLKDRPEGLTALEILAEINTRYFGDRIIRSSLSPQLSRLKDRDHKIGLRGKKWFLLPQQPSLFVERRD